MLAPALTPSLADRFGWELIPKLYGLGVLALCVNFALLAPASPPSLPPLATLVTGGGRSPVSSMSRASVALGGGCSCGGVRCPLCLAARQAAELAAAAAAGEAESVTVWSMLCTPPAWALILDQFGHDMMEYSHALQWCGELASSPFSIGCSRHSSAWRFVLSLPSASLAGPFLRIQLLASGVAITQHVPSPLSLKPAGLQSLSTCRLLCH